MKINHPMPKVLHLEFDSRIEMNLSICRIQEFYESPYDNIKGKYFTLEQFIRTYSDKEGNINYFSYWEGFDIPRKSIAEFQRLFLDISYLESKILDLFTEDYEYLIATDVSCDPTTLQHELAHAKYSLDEEYRNKVNQILFNLDGRTLNKMIKDLLDGEYPDDPYILLDEIHAYLLTSKDFELQSVFKSVVSEDYEVCRSILTNTFNSN